MRVVPEAKRLVQVGVVYRDSRVVGQPFYIPYGGNSTQVAVCECVKCGKVTVKQCSWLKNHGAGCVCNAAEAASKRVGPKNPHYRDGGADRRLYNIWKGMHNRCTDPRVHNYHRYGGRGIRVCDEWNDFFVFKAWALANGYNETLTIERERSDGNYEPSNCRWATLLEQARNTSNNVPRRAFGETKMIWEWLEDGRCVVKSKRALENRICLGWVFEEAITTPLGTPTKPVLIEAFGETKSAAAWSRDNRCVVDKSGLCRRIKRGMAGEEAITTPSKMAMQRKDAK